jgi:hypothetical protein
LTGREDGRRFISPLDPGRKIRHFLAMPTHFATAPELVTERLVLHGHGLKDFAESAAMWGDADVVRFIGGRAFTEEEVWTRLLRYVGHWATMG